MSLRLAHSRRRGHAPRRPASAPAHGFGALALAWLLARDGSARPRVQSAGAEAAALPGQGEVRHLPVHGRRAEPDRHVRSQAGARKIRRPAASRQFRHSRQPVHQRRHAAAGVALEVQEVRRVRHARSPRCCRTWRSAWTTSASCARFYTESVVHAPAMYQVHTGRILMGYPSMGSWITYGLGSESDNLPAYVVMPQPEGTPEGGTPCWGAGFLPAVYQGTLFRAGSEPDSESEAARRHDARAPARHARPAAEDERAGHRSTATPKWRRASAPTSWRSGCRATRPRRSIFPRRPKRRGKLYGLDQKRTAEFGTRCLLARRLVERGVRFVQLYSGGGPVSMQWDAHKDLVGNHEKMCGMTDQPDRGAAAGSETARAARFDAGDLGQRIRPPADVAERQRARPQSARLHHVVRRRRRQGGDHHRRDRRTRPARRWHALSMRDFHATILHLLGLDQNRLWYLHNGRKEKLTDFGGNVIREMLEGRLRWGRRFACPRPSEARRVPLRPLANEGRRIACPTSTHGMW